MGENNFAPVPTALYGVPLLMAAIAFAILEKTIIVSQGENSPLARATGDNRKEMASTALYALAIPLTFVSPYLAGGLYVAVAILWLIPDRRIERLFADGHGPNP
jgi:uncharacterized membrane protein